MNLNPFRMFSSRNYAPPAQKAVCLLPSGQTVIRDVTQTRSPNDKRTPDDLLFESWVPHEFNHRRGCYSFPVQQPVTRQMIEAIAAEAGELFSKTDKQKLADLAAEDKRLDVLMEQNSFLRVSGHLPLALQSAVDGAIARGEQPPAVASYQERLLQTSTTRKAIHKRKAEIRAEAFVIIGPAAEKFSWACYAAAHAQHKQEQGGLLARWKMHFVPSQLLVSLAYLALRSREIIRGFEEVGTLSISSDPLVLWGPYLRSEPAKPGPTRAEAMKAQREEQARREAQELEQERERHAAKLAEVNRFNNAIRNQPPGAPVAKGYHVPVPSSEPSPAQPQPEQATQSAQPEQAAPSQPEAKQ